MRGFVRTLLAPALLAAAGLAVSALPAQDADGDPFTIVVMDPLSAPLSCPCVAGYAQRKYEELGAHLERSLGRKVRVVFRESLAEALKTQTGGRADLVIGKHSVVLADAKKAKFQVSELARLTDKSGATTQTGLFVVPSADPAESIADLGGYRILFGPADCDEKSAAPMRQLAAEGLALPKKIETSPSCSEAATSVLELGADVRAAAVISSYAQPLLEGCGTIDKGALRVVGKTAPVPFIAAFVPSTITKEARAKLEAAMLDVAKHPKLLVAIESKAGFVKPDAPKAAQKRGEADEGAAQKRGEADEGAAQKRGDGTRAEPPAEKKTRR